jgi:hypothetical protein
MLPGRIHLEINVTKVSPGEPVSSGLHVGTVSGQQHIHLTDADLAHRIAVWPEPDLRR